MFCFHADGRRSKRSARAWAAPAGKGLLVTFCAHYPRVLLYVIVGLLLLANTINLGAADLGATWPLRAEAAGWRSGQSLRCGFRRRLHLARGVFAIPALCLHLERGSFVLLAYVAVAIVVDVPWKLVLHSTFVPNFSLEKDYVVTVVAVLGTTITPYCFFWQSSQEAEDERLHPTAHALIDAPEQAPTEISRMRFDTYIGMGYSNVISLFIIVATAATLNAHGVTDIQTSAQAAEALWPIAGVFPPSPCSQRALSASACSRSPCSPPHWAPYALGEALGWTTGSRSQTARRQGILRYDRDFNPYRRRHQLRRPRSNQGVVLVGGNQRRCGGSVDGDHHAHGDARRRDGRLRAAVGAVGDGVVVHRDDGGRSRDHVCDLVRAQGGCARCMRSLASGEIGSPTAATRRKICGVVGGVRGTFSGLPGWGSGSAESPTNISTPSNPRRRSDPATGNADGAAQKAARVQHAGAFSGLSRRERR